MILLHNADKPFESQAARDAERRGYGGAVYWRYLDQHARELRDHYLSIGEPDKADEMMARSLADALRGNDGP